MRLTRAARRLGAEALALVLLLAALAAGGLILGFGMVVLEPLILTAPLWVGAGVGLFFLSRFIRTRLTRRPA